MAATEISSHDNGSGSINDPRCTRVLPFPEVFMPVVPTTAYSQAATRYRSLARCGGSMRNLQPKRYLPLWEWREVNLIGATQPITVRIRYEKGPTAAYARYRSRTDSQR